jgi:hypothetical protein
VHDPAYQPDPPDAPAGDPPSIITLLAEQLSTAYGDGVRIGRLLQAEEDREAWRATEAEHGRWREYARTDTWQAFAAELREGRDTDVRAAVVCLAEHGAGDARKAIQTCDCRGSRVLHQALTIPHEATT